SWWQEHARATGSMRAWYIHLTLPRDALERRIADRVDAMLGAGLVDEVRRTLERPVAPDAPGLDGGGCHEEAAIRGGRPPGRARGPRRPSWASSSRAAGTRSTSCPTPAPSGCAATPSA